MDPNYKRCPKCHLLRSENSFIVKQSQRTRKICHACHFRRGRRPVIASRVLAVEILERQQKAIREVVRQEQQKRSFVYLLKVGPKCKIGISTNVNARIRQLRTGASDVVELLAVAPGDRQQEKILHQTFQEWWTVGEWFEYHSAFAKEFSTLPGALVFLPPYISQQPVE